jgi:hypothetical protein
MHASHSTVRPARREHWPVYPKSFIVIRIVQLVLAVIILALDAFTVAYLVTYGNELTLFTVSQNNRLFFSPWTEYSSIRAL